MSDEIWGKLIKLDPTDEPEKPERFYTEDSDGLFSTPDGHFFGPEIMKDIEAAFDAILNEENPDED